MGLTLVLGGTSFVGRYMVESALAAGLDVALFNRGVTDPSLFSGVPRFIGDRASGDYSALAGLSFDAVVDVSGYVPRHVDQAMAALGSRVGRYLFVSSHAVYSRAPEVGPGSDEDCPLRPEVRDTEELTEETYGPLKVACENDVLARLGPRSTIVRLGKVAGPFDPQDTFTYWVRRAAVGGTVAVPGDPAQPVQIIDVRDVASFVVRLLLDDRGGVFNVLGPEPPATLGGVIGLCAIGPLSLVRVPASGPLFPLVREVWSTQQRTAARARAAGLVLRPLADTAADVRAWDRSRGEPPLPVGFTPSDEAAALAR